MQDSLFTDIGLNKKDNRKPLNAKGRPASILFNLEKSVKFENTQTKILPCSFFQSIEELLHHRFLIAKDNYISIALAYVKETNTYYLVVPVLDNMTKYDYKELLKGYQAIIEHPEVIENHVELQGTVLTMVDNYPILGKIQEMTDEEFDACPIVPKGYNHETGKIY